MQSLRTGGIDMLYYLVIGVLLLVCSVQDIRKKEISNISLLIGAGVVVFVLLAEGVLCENLFSAEASWWKNCCGMIPGICVWILSYVTRGGIGTGDGYLLCISGAALGLDVNLALLCYGLLLAGAFSGILLVMRRVKRETKLPFVPFLTGGYLLTVLQLI